MKRTSVFKTLWISRSRASIEEGESNQEALLFNPNGHQHQAFPVRQSHVRGTQSRDSAVTVVLTLRASARAAAPSSPILLTAGGGKPQKVDGAFGDTYMFDVTRETDQKKR